MSQPGKREGTELPCLTQGKRSFEESPDSIEHGGC